jgi:ubiquinone/menaquinone biosynthesis C-methylase UbiE
VEWADLQPGESVLDVGYGRGASLFPAAERVGPNGRVLGVDLSAEMVDLLRVDIDGCGVTNARRCR